MHVSEVWAPSYFTGDLQRPHDVIDRMKQCDGLWNGQLVQVCFGSIITKGIRVDIAMEQYHKCIHLSVPSEWKVFLFPL
jgi:hypothetical protein